MNSYGVGFSGGGCYQGTQIPTSDFKECVPEWAYTRANLGSRFGIHVRVPMRFIRVAVGRDHSYRAYRDMSIHLLDDNRCVMGGCFFGILNRQKYLKLR